MWIARDIRMLEHIHEIAFLNRDDDVLKAVTSAPLQEPILLIIPIEGHTAESNTCVPFVNTDPVRCLLNGRDALKCDD
jgi:hypothetical protein